MFDIPIVVFIFKRVDKSALIIQRLSEIAPQKIYIIADGARNVEEEALVLQCRNKVEENITWPCEIIKNYASHNRGVFENIAGGARWVFEREETAIFLEDDNFPALSFFPFCKEMLEKYKDNQQILWICGSNYLIKSSFPNGASYGFTQNMLPCGWASWSKKFNRYYQADFNLWNNQEIRKRIKKLKYSHALKRQEQRTWESELHNKQKMGRYISWDYQMSFSLRSQNLLGIIPKYNQIKNIGVDLDSIHGGSSMELEMTSRFCENQIYELEFPLKHPDCIALNPKFEKKLGDLILYPLKNRIYSTIVRCIKKCFGKKIYESLRHRFVQFFKHRLL